MKYCGNCGKQLNDDVKFCTQCGAKCEAPVAVPDASSVQPAGNSAPIYNAPIVAAESSDAKKAAAKKLSAIFIGLFALMMLTLFVSIALAMSDSNSTRNNAKKYSYSSSTTSTQTEKSNSSYASFPSCYSARIKLTDYLGKHGYDISTWNVTNSSPDNYKAYGPGGAMIIADSDYLLISLSSSSTNTILINKSQNVVDVMLTDSSVDAYEILYLILSDSSSIEYSDLSSMKAKANNSSGWVDTKIGNMYFRAGEINNLVSVGVHFNSPPMNWNS